MTEDKNKQERDALLTLINAYGRACRRDGNPAWESDEGKALMAALSQPQAGGTLSDEDIIDIASEHCDEYGWMNGDGIMAFARAILARSTADASNAATGPQFNHGEWIRNNYQDHQNIASLLNAMEWAERNAAPAAPATSGVRIGNIGTAACVPDSAPAPAAQADRFERIKRLALDAGGEGALPVPASLAKIVRECINGIGQQSATPADAASEAGADFHVAVTVRIGDTVTEQVSTEIAWDRAMSPRAMLSAMAMASIDIAMSNQAQKGGGDAG